MLILILVSRRNYCFLPVICESSLGRGDDRTRDRDRGHWDRDAKDDRWRADDSGGSSGGGNAGKKKGVAEDDRDGDWERDRDRDRERDRQRDKGSSGRKDKLSSAAVPVTAPTQLALPAGKVPLDCKHIFSTKSLRQFISLLSKQRLYMMPSRAVLVACFSLRLEMPAKLSSKRNVDETMKTAVVEAAAEETIATIEGR